MNYIVALLLTLVLFAGDSKAIAKESNGHELYQQYCAACHGVDYKGGKASSLADGLWSYGSKLNHHRRNVRNGIAVKGMPAFVNLLSNAEIEAILKHAISLEGTLDLPGARPLPKTVRTLDYILKVEEVIPESKGLKTPWSIDFISSDTWLITEKPGRLRLYDKGQLVRKPVAEFANLETSNQGGLLDVRVDPHYKKNGWVYLSLSHTLGDKGKQPAMTKVVRGQIKKGAWHKQQTVFEAPHNTYRSAHQHYGSRIDFDSKGHLYFTVGDRGSGKTSQDLSLPNGKVHRVYPDGKIPPDNPFLNNPKALPSIYSYGHRNPQGFAVKSDDSLWSSEHGPMGGDELNVVLKGANYGWNLLSFGREYSGKVLTETRFAEGFEAPTWVWRPSTGVCGIDFYEGKQFPYWQNHLLVGALKDQDLRLLHIDKKRVINEEILFSGHGRVRDVSVGPDGAIYLVLNQPDRIVRLSYESDTPY